jgi:hypothetical protein
MGMRLVNSRATLMSELVRMQYDETGVIDYKARNLIKLKLLEASHQRYGLFMGTLPEEFDVVSRAINYNVDTIEDVIDKLRQIEIGEAFNPVIMNVWFFLCIKRNTWNEVPTARGRHTVRSSSSRSIALSDMCYECGEHGHRVVNCSKRKKL